LIGFARNDALERPGAEIQALGDVIGLVRDRIARIACELAICCDGDNDASLETLEALVAHRLPASENKATFKWASAETRGIGACSSAVVVQ
jgi:hypothetical protein